MEQQQPDFISETLKRLITALVDKVVNAQTIDDAERALTLLEKALERLTERERQTEAKQRAERR